MVLTDEIAPRGRSTGCSISVECHHFPFGRISLGRLDHRFLRRVTVGGSEVCCRLDTASFYHEDKVFGHRFIGSLVEQLRSEVWVVR